MLDLAKDRSEDFARLFNRLVGRSATALEYEAALSKFLDPEYQFDPTSSDDQRAVDLLLRQYRHGSADATSAFLHRVGVRTDLAPVVQAAADEAATADSFLEPLKLEK